MKTNEELRDYFAANAPETPAPWFVPTGDEPPPSWSASKLKMPHGNSASGGCCKLCDEYFAKRAQEDNDNKRKRGEYELRRYVQWPWAYADAMLKQRSL